LEVFFVAEQRMFTLKDEQMYQELVPMGASIGSSGPEIRKGSTMSHGMFVTNKKDGKLYGLSAAHGLGGDTESHPEHLGRLIVSPSSRDMFRAKQVLMAQLPVFESKAMSARKKASNNPKDRDLDQDAKDEEDIHAALKKIQENIFLTEENTSHTEL